MLCQLSATKTVVRSMVTGIDNATGPDCRASCNSSVSAHTIAHNIPIAQALQLLGKLGGRNRRFLKDPLELEYKDNPEHGLRLILTFQPATSFLVPLDRTITLVRGALLPDGSAARLQPFARSEALRFLQVCWLILAHTTGAGIITFFKGCVQYDFCCGNSPSMYSSQSPVSSVSLLVEAAIGPGVESLPHAGNFMPVML